MGLKPFNYYHEYLFWHSLCTMVSWRFLYRRHVIAYDSGTSELDDPVESNMRTFHVVYSSGFSFVPSPNAIDSSIILLIMERKTGRSSVATRIMEEADSVLQLYVAVALIIDSLFVLSLQIT